MNTPISKKIVSLIVITSFAVGPITTYATGIPVVDLSNLEINTNSTVEQTLSQIDQAFGYLKTFGLDGLAYVLAQKVSQKLVSATLNAVNGGASANKPPNYVANYAQYFASLGGKTTTNYYNSLQYSNNPFAAGIAQGIINTNSGFAPSGLDAFNLNSILKNGASWKSAALNLGNAGIQGFDFYSALAYPQNTPLGSNLIAQQQLGQNLATAQNLAKIQLTSTGFKPQTLENSAKGIFASIGSQYGVNTNSLINASQQAAHDQQVANGLNNANKNGPTAQETALANLNNNDFSGGPGSQGDYAPGGLYTNPDGSPTQAGLDSLPQDNPDNPSQPASTGTYYGPGGNPNGNGQGQENNPNAGPLAPFYGPGGDPNGSGAGEENYSSSSDVGADVASPASTNENNVNSAAQEPAKRYQNADQFFKLIFSTLAQLATGLINKGIASLSSDAGSHSKSQYGSPADAARITASGGSWLATPQTIIDFKNDLGDAYQKTTLDVQYNQEMIDRIKDAVTGSVMNSADITANKSWMKSHGTPFDDSLDIFEQFQAFNKANPSTPLPNPGTDHTLEKLEQCIPGPDTGWESRLSDYTTQQLSETRDGQNGTGAGADVGVNQRAETLVTQLVQTASQEEEERLTNPFLNIPSASELRLVASSYYQNTTKFQGYFTTLLTKRQTASDLGVIVAQVTALVKTVDPKAILIDNQWQNLSSQDKLSTYNHFVPSIITDLPNDYAVPTGKTPASVDDPTTPTINEQTAMQIKPLPTGAPGLTSAMVAAADDAEMEKRVIAESWDLWDTSQTITENQRQNVYGQYAADQQNITSSGLLQNTKNSLQALENQNTEMGDALHDCLAIRDAVKNHAGANASGGQWSPTDWSTFKGNLYSDRIKGAFVPDTSIVAVANGTTSNLDWSHEGEINLPISLIENFPNADSNGLGGTICSNQLLNDLCFTKSLPDPLLYLVHPLTRLLAGQEQGNYLNSTAANNVFPEDMNLLQVQPIIPKTTDSITVPVCLPDDTRCQSTYSPPSQQLPASIGVDSSLIIPSFFQEDDDGTLFCRLPSYLLVFWSPHGARGQPISCSQKLKYVDSSSSSTRQRTAGTLPDWYHINRAEIYYSLNKTTY